MNKLRRLIGKNALAAIGVGMGVSTVAGAVFTQGGHEETPLTGFFADHEIANSYCYIRFYWNGDTSYQFKRVYKHRTSAASVSLYYGDGNSFVFDEIFDANVDTWASLECYMENPTWFQYQYYHSWSYVAI